jgi:hypothetical protein
MGCLEYHPPVLQVAAGQAEAFWVLETLGNEGLDKVGIYDLLGNLS